MSKRKLAPVWILMQRPRAAMKPKAPLTYTVQKMSKDDAEEAEYRGCWPFYIYGTHTCLGCKEEKDVHEFRIDTNLRRPFPRCRACEGEARRKVVDSFPGRISLMVNSARARARKTGMPFELTVEIVTEMWRAQGGRCALSGEPLSTETLQWNTASLDRQEGEVGYVRRNVRLVTDTVNRMRGNIPDEVFFDYCLAVAEQTFGFKLTRPDLTRAGSGETVEETVDEE